jgi:hypothetical protein
MEHLIDISVAGEGGGSSIPWIFIYVFSGDLSFFLTGHFSSFSFSLIILTHDMMERRLDDSVRLMTKGEKVEDVGGTQVTRGAQGYLEEN